MKLQLFIKNKMLKSEGHFCFKTVVSILLIVGISTFKSRMNFMLIQVEHEKRFITSILGPSSLIHKNANLANVRC